MSQSEIPRLSKVTQETNERKATEEARLARLRTATVTATKDGKIQKLFAREGKLLHSGESIASIALPVESTTEAINNVVIECAITDSLAKNINVRDEITAYLMSNQRKVRGRVIEKIEPSSAIESGTADKSDWSDDFISEPRNRTHTIVRIAIEGETPAWLNNDIKIPQGVKVMFLGNNPSVLDRFLATLARIGRF